MSERAAVVRQPGEGRAYPMGRIAAVFKADETETAQAYSVPEWWRVRAGDAEHRGVLRSASGGRRALNTGGCTSRWSLVV